MDILDGVKDFKDKITITKDGVEKPCMIMFSFEMNGKEFIVYTDGSVNNQGNINAYASILDRSIENGKVLPITDEEELKVTNQMIQNFAESLNKTLLEDIK